jgi:TRAP-type C4-dicarboxylate transport system permease small subunit
MTGSAAARIWLRRLYGACAALGGLLFVGVAGFILYQLGSEVFDYIPRSADEFAGYCMAGSAFLALAYTFNAGEHIRVTLIAHRLRGRSLDIFAMLVSLGLAAYLAWYMVKMAWVSWQLDETTQGLIALPLWIPQSAMALGAAVFFVAVAEKSLRVVTGEEIDSAESEGTARADR